MATPWDTRLAGIRRKLDALRERDRELRVFGAGGEQGHGYREWPPMSEGGLATREAELGVAFPDELRAFLAAVHAGGPGPGYDFGAGDFVTPQPQCRRPFPYGADDIARWRAAQARGEHGGLPLEDEQPGDENLWPPGSGFLLLTHHGCGTYDVIVVTGPERGRIWFCDMAWYPREQGFLDWYEGWLDANLPPT